MKQLSRLAVAAIMIATLSTLGGCWWGPPPGGPGGPGGGGHYDHDHGPGPGGPGGSGDGRQGPG